MKVFTFDEDGLHPAGEGVEAAHEAIAQALGEPSVPGLRPKVHVWELFLEIERLQQVIKKANEDELWRQPAEWARVVEEAEGLFQRWCVENGLGLDFTGGPRAKLGGLT